MFKNLTTYQIKKKFGDNFVKQKFKYDQCVYTQDTIPSHIYVVASGNFDVLVKHKIY